MADAADTSWRRAFLDGLDETFIPFRSQFIAFLFGGLLGYLDIQALLVFAGFWMFGGLAYRVAEMQDTQTDRSGG